MNCQCPYLSRQTVAPVLLFFSGSVGSRWAWKASPAASDRPNSGQHEMPKNIPVTSLQHVMRCRTRKRHLPGASFCFHLKNAQRWLSKQRLCCIHCALMVLQGDSGGPLLVRSSFGSPWTVAGIVSYGIGMYLAFQFINTSIQIK